MKPERLLAAKDTGTVCGLRDRLNSHASGRRSGDQFGVYVAGRFVLPTLSREQITEIGAGKQSFDRLVRDYIRARLAFAFVTLVGFSTEVQQTAFRLEGTSGQGRHLSGGRMLNP